MLCGTPLCTSRSSVKSHGRWQFFTCLDVNSLDIRIKDYFTLSSKESQITEGTGNMKRILEGESYEYQQCPPTQLRKIRILEAMLIFALLCYSYIPIHHLLVYTCGT